MVKISRLKLENFRSFQKLDFEMLDLNILIGRNGSGKSNLLSFFRLMHEAANEKLAETIRLEGGTRNVVWKGIQWEEAENVVKILIEIIGLMPLSIEYDIEFGIFENSLVVYCERIKNRDIVFYDFDLGHHHKIYDAINKKTIDLGEGRDEFEELIITQLRDKTRYRTLDVLRECLANWSIYRGFSERAIEHLYDSQMLDVVSPPRLDPEGRNLISVLYAMQNETRYNKAYETLEETLQEAFPEFKRLQFPLTASGRAELRWVNKNGWDFPARATSDGMLRFLALATLLLLPEPPPLIAIDEPEIGLHPRLLPRLAELLKDASQRTQIVVATHSPQLLSAEPIQPEDVVVVDLEDGETRFKRLNSDDLKLWLDRFTLGNLWTMGRLEAQP